jgi:competence protein ComEC
MHKKSDSFLSDTLILGYKSAITESDKEIWTETGVGHIWSISGFHMTLVGGWLFALFYLIFRSIPYITRRIPAKIPATVLTWFGLFFYLLLSGTDVATIRAFVMTSLVFIAFIVGRSAISMRNVALAFCLIFFINPHYVMQAGFQLSFAAVFGLVWLYQDLKPKMPQNKLLKVLYALILTSVVATIFTAPFIAAQFGQFPTYSLLGNLIFLPIFSVAIMPLIMLGTITAILGFTYPIHLAHNIYEFAYQIALWISDLPISVVNIPYISNASLILFIIGFICLIAIKSKDMKINYILFVTFVILGIISVHTTRKPVFYSSHDNELVGFVKPDGNIEFNKSRSSKHYFTFDTWKQINGEQIKTPNIRKKHDKGVYRYNTEKFNLVYILKFTSLMNNISQLCNDDNIDFIVSYHDIESKHCKHKILQGGFVIYPNRRIKRAPTNRKWHQ